MKNLFAVIALLLIVAVTAQSQTIGSHRQHRTTSSTIISVDTTGTGTDDTLRLASSTYSWIKLRIKGAATDSIGNITGGIDGTCYEFSVVANDSQTVFRDQGKLKLGAARILNKVTDRLFLRYVAADSTYVEVGFYNND